MAECTRCKKKLTKENTRTLANSLGAPSPYCKECAYDKNWKIRPGVSGVAPVKLRSSLSGHIIAMVVFVIAIVIFNIIFYSDYIILTIIDIILILFIIIVLVRYKNLKKIEKEL